MNGKFAREVGKIHTTMRNVTFMLCSKWAKTHKTTMMIIKRPLKSCEWITVLHQAE